MTKVVVDVMTANGSRGRFTVAARKRDSDRLLTSTIAHPPLIAVAADIRKYSEFLRLCQNKRGSPARNLETTVFGRGGGQNPLRVLRRCRKPAFGVPKSASTAVELEAVTLSWDRLPNRLEAYPTLALR
jgi:hypothetical protein